MNAKKKILLGMDYEVSVPLSAYGGAIFRVHAISDVDLAKIEDRVGYTLAEVLEALASSGLTPAELEAAKNNRASAETLKKLSSQMMKPKMKLFMAELCKEGLLPDDPDPECLMCKGNAAYRKDEALCECRDLAGSVDDLKGFSILELGTAIIAASTADWKQVEEFFLRQKGQSGPASSASKA